MRELPKQLLAWLARLLPKQEARGHGAIQVGKVAGNVTIVHVTQPAQVQPAGLTTAEQREVLALIRGVPNKAAVFAWMEKTFGTRMVMDLKPSELLRTRRYVESIHKRMTKERL